MIEQFVKIHDRYQFEIKLGYLTAERKNPLYDIEIYFFIPSSLAINRSTYSKEDFFSDLQTYIRFKTPEVPLEDLAENPQSPFGILEKSIRNLLDSPKDRHVIKSFRNSIRMFCCIAKSSFRDYALSGRTAEKQEAFVLHARKITGRFRQWRPKLDNGLIPSELFQIYLFADEYISLLAEKYAYDLLEKEKAPPSGSGKDANRPLLELVRSELEYRKKNKYLSLPDEGTNSEMMMYRKSVLKKFMESVLFLRTRTEREGKFLEQVLFGIAAGISMLFATAVAYYSQYRYGTLTFPVFLALIVSYMFKDRIKELMRYYFHKKIRGFLFDHKTDIYSGPEQKLGWSKESFEFLKHSMVPEQVKIIRNIDSITRIEDAWYKEKTALYRERVRLFPEKIRETYGDFTVQDINDIMRFNILKFISRMDNPRKRLFVPEGEGYTRIFAYRVYHLNLVIRYATGDREFFSRFRIVMSRDGLQRIEEVRIHP